MVTRFIVACLVMTFAPPIICYAVRRVPPGPLLDVALVAFMALIGWALAYAIAHAG